MWYSTETLLLPKHFKEELHDSQVWSKDNVGLGGCDHFPVSRHCHDLKIPRVAFGFRHLDSGFVHDRAIYRRLLIVILIKQVNT